ICACGVTGRSSRLILLPLRGRSRGKPRSYKVVCEGLMHASKNARSVSSSQHCYCTRQSRHHKTRLGCRPNADDAQWAERHGCRESAARTWMSVQRGPTERRRSAGTRRRRAKPGAKRFWSLLAGPAFRALLPKVTRCKSGTIIRRYRSNGYSHHPAANTKNQKTYLSGIGIGNGITFPV
ncbi:hypothetical protein SAMN03159444_04666, partial [Pseudomonas sp. NFACC02]